MSIKHPSIHIIQMIPINLNVNFHMFIYVFKAVCTGNMQNCPRQLAMQSCVLCSFVRCGTSNQIERKKRKKDNRVKQVF